MDILIKSFNRPFYLDRCLSSIYQYVAGNFSIKVLDDGTPEKYLNKIQTKFPSITIIKSDSYNEKSAAILKNSSSETKINGFQIPVSLWIEAAKNASDYFIMTEDDVWFTEKIYLNDLHDNVKKSQINLLKLGWLGNTKEEAFSNKFPISDHLNAIQPKNLFLGNKMVMEAFFYNRYHFYSLLYKLKLVDNITRNKYWILNSILMGLYKKEYWLEIWKDMEGKVDEKKQLLNASVFYGKNRKNPNFIAQLKTEAMKTTFQSSATNSYHKYSIDFDVNYFNHLINEAWLAGKFDSMQNFPKDFSIDYFTTFLDDKINLADFRKWIDQFKKQYRNLGASVDD